MAKKLKIPYGFRDCLPDECYFKDGLERELSELFRTYGYLKTETPTVEYYDTFHDVCRPEMLKKMFKLTDNDGSLLALRPDVTLQVCRMAAATDIPNPKRLYYVENSFEYLDSPDTARTREYSQIGVELLGDTGIDGEEEILCLAVESFLRAGLTDFVIEIGNNDLFRTLAAEANLSTRDESELIKLINKKDGGGAEAFLKKCGADTAVVAKTVSLIRLFGGKEVFAAARKTIGENAAIDSVETLFGRLVEKGYGKYVSVDFGTLNGYDYYSGLVIKGFTAGHGFALLDGGRYDGVCPSFGYESGAVGFALGTKRLMTALEAIGKVSRVPSLDWVYSSDGRSDKEEWKFACELRNQGKTVAELFGFDKAALENYCRENSVKNAAYFDNGKKYLLRGEEK